MEKNSSYLSRDQIEDLLIYCGASKLKSHENKEDIMCCCPVHGESNPSCGVSVDKQIFHCFSCGASGDFVWMLHLSLPEEFKHLTKAREFLAHRYSITFRELTKDFLKLKSYDEINMKTIKNVLPRYKLAPFQSGKKTFNYILDRGITKQTLKRFMIGRDEDLETVTIPIFWEDNSLAGIIGRFISEDTPYNMRYHLYDGFERKNLIFPLDKLDASSNTGIMVEGILDAVWMHQMGFVNTFSILGNQMTCEQARLVGERFDTVIDMFDNDSGGERSTEIAIKRLKNKVLNYRIASYPESKKDPMECNFLELRKMVKEAKSPLKIKLKN